ncbi:class II aldolase/adducin family protein [Caldisericum exile]|uniref:L-fuculose phosphate aldolase n=1 Tax=Caldisericum exile (strain DSM 21853 / NBRC 104410 / AZM16c01) TaxID=511051 RepID=A0A7U6GFE3_CALEA|nr:class II aldolase/adducin family protein [Caldisericum exile]BAL81376.1 L-fuculose phosphate aldolase [Caldisericum exile AZM16c01]
MKRQIKEDIAAIGRRLYEHQLNGSYGGNFSVREEEFIYITPSGVPKDELDYSDILVIDFSGNVVEGEGKPSSEILFHIKIYKVRPDVNAIIHAHPPYATGFAIANSSIPNNVHEESTLILGDVPVIPYEITSSKELAENIGKAIQDHNALLLANHGALTVGDTLERAFRRMEELENLCKMLTVANLLGGAKPIPQDKLENLLTLSLTLHF